MKKVALLTCKDLGPFGEHDDHLLIEALENINIMAEEVVWNSNFDPSNYNLVLIRTTWDYSDHRVEFLDKLQELKKKAQVFNPVDLVIWNSDKLYLKDLEELGVRTLKTLWIPQGEEINLSELKDVLKSDKIILKPSVGAGADGLVKVISENDLKNLPEKLLSAPNIMAQALQKEIYDGERSMMFFKGEFSHAVNKVPVGDDIRSQGCYGADVKTYIPSTKEIDFAKFVLSKLPMKPLQARIDTININGEPTLMELEMIEPHLYFSWDKNAASHFALEVKQAIK